MEHRSLAPNLVIPTDGNAGRNQLAGEPASDVASGELLEKKQMGRAENCSDLELSNYLQALAEGCLVTYYSDTKPSALSKSISIASRSYRQGRKTVHFHGFQSLEMSRNSTGVRGEELLTWFLEASRARTSALPEAGPDWTAKGQGYGEKWLGLLGKYDPASCSLKTAQLSLLEDLTESSPTLPRFGLMLDGELYQQPTPALRTEENESGSLEKFPTPNCFDAIPDFADRKDNNLLDGGRHGVSIRHLVKIWPTPTTSASKGSSQNSLTRKDGRSRIGDRLDHSVMASDAGQLNPDWVELLMGWPLGHTNLKQMNEGEFYGWFEGFSRQDLRGMRQAVQQKSNAERTDSGCEDVSTPEALQQGMWKQPEGIEAEKLFMESKEAQEGCLRGVRLHEETNCSSLRSGSDEQRPEQSSNAMQSLSRLLARYGQEAWKAGSWEDGVPRVINGVAHRSLRLKAIGNGQVPRVRAAAWSLLYGN